MLLLAQLLHRLQLLHGLYRALGGASRRRTRRVWLAGLCSLTLLGGCASTDSQARFRLDSKTGMPVVGVGNEQYQLDWRGRMVFGFLDRKQVSSNHDAISGDSLAVLAEKTASLIKPQVDGKVDYVYAAPPAPQGWHTCVAVTTYLNQDGTRPQSTVSKRSAPIVTAQFFDALTGEKLAELDLNTIFASLYYAEPGPDFRAQVRSAAIGPDGGIGLLLWFAQGGDYYLDGGIWDGTTWTPLMCIQPSGAVGQQQEIYVGPGNNSILQTPYSLFFSGSDGRLLNIWVLKGSFLRLFQQSLATGLIKAVLIASAGGLFGVAIMGFFWQLLSERSRRRRRR